MAGNSVSSDSRSPFSRAESGVLWVLWLTYGSFYFCRTNISAAIPGIEAEFGFTKTQIGLILGSLKLAYGFGQLVNGQLAEKISARKLLTIGMLTSALLNVIFGFGASVYFLLFIWACNGYFQALGWTPCMRVTANWFPVEKRGRAVGIIGTGYQATAAITFVVAGFSAQWLGWRGALYVPAILFALSCVHMLVFLKEEPPEPRQSASEEAAPPKPRNTNSIGQNILLTLTNPWLWFLALSLGLLNACRYGFLDWGLAHLIETQGGNVGKSALKYAVLPLGGIAGAFLSGWVTDRWFGGRAAPAIVVLLLALGVLTLIYSKSGGGWRKHHPAHHAAGRYWILHLRPAGSSRWYSAYGSGPRRRGRRGGWIRQFHGLHGRFLRRCAYGSDRGRKRLASRAHLLGQLRLCRRHHQRLSLEQTLRRKRIQIIMRVIFIGAGRGSRLMPTTENEPKCFAQVQGTRILDWNLRAFAKNGIDDICFIGGYLIDTVREAYPHFTFRHNDNWENNNILASLMYAEDLMDEPFICCYSDTLYSANLIAGLAASEHEITLSVDTGWVERYADRTEHPADDAEKVTAENGVITRIHRGIDSAEAWGEYTGVANFSVTGAQHLKQHYHRCRAKFAGQPFREAKVFEKAYFIHLLQEMVEHGVDMHHTDTSGEYIEIDTQQDFEYAQTNWKH